MGNASWTTVAVISTVGGTGLCSYGVRGVDGSRAEHLTVESCRSIFLVFFCFSGAARGSGGTPPPKLGSQENPTRKFLAAPLS